ncbi:hypothetical protein EVAR_78629_1 [Eumeta japonica]|uniref:Uncharacterized protein n=1 Tax=Eumeta variegata TaxID=151549 RepID=A0A4C1U7R2_EUMVA|nr:hypothetical protein EVAR_78629_1 [Eumeta japonica]
MSTGDRRAKDCIRPSGRRSGRGGPARESETRCDGTGRRESSFIHTRGATASAAMSAEAVGPFIFPGRGDSGRDRSNPTAARKRKRAAVGCATAPPAAANPSCYCPSRFDKKNCKSRTEGSIPKLSICILILFVV